jgi:hypothetical protein
MAFAAPSFDAPVQQQRSDARTCCNFAASGLDFALSRR